MAGADAYGPFDVPYLPARFARWRPTARRNFEFLTPNSVTHAPSLVGFQSLSGQCACYSSRERRAQPLTLFARYKSTFAGLPRPAWLLATVLLVNTSGTMVVFFMTLYLTRHLGWPAARAGMGMSGYGVGMLTLPLLTTLVSLRASASAQGRYQGLYTMSYSVGVTIGPVLGTWIYTTFGGPMLWTAVGGVGAIVAGSMLILSLKWDGLAQVGSAASA